MRALARQGLVLTTLGSSVEKQRPGSYRGGTVSEEARTGKRFPLELPIKIQGVEQGSTTGNMSAAGVYIRGNPALDVGSSVEFEIALPPELTGGRGRRGCGPRRGS